MTPEVQKVIETELKRLLNEHNLTAVSLHYHKEVGCEFFNTYAHAGGGLCAHSIAKDIATSAETAVVKVRELPPTPDKEEDA